MATGGNIIHQQIRNETKLLHKTRKTQKSTKLSISKLEFITLHGWNYLQLHSFSGLQTPVLKGLVTGQTKMRDLRVGLVLNICSC